MKVMIKKILILFLPVLIYSGCRINPEIESLPLSVRANLNYLQENPQFVMYLNFKNMRQSEFWNRHVSDSLLNAERSFGSLMNMFKNATGASISDGLDELYFSNSWVGENAIVLKGIFDRDKLHSFIEDDTTFSITKYADGTNIYMNEIDGLHFFFKDNFTLCASNYLNQLDAMISLKNSDTSGILKNPGLIKVIERIQFKDNLWMVTTEKTFIRGVFLNFLGDNRNTIAGETDNLNSDDTLQTDSQNISDELFQMVSSISFSAKMKNELDFVIQAMCESEKDAEYLSSVIRGIIAFSKINTSLRNRESLPSKNILDGIKVRTKNNELYVDINVNDKNIDEFRKAPVLTEPAPEE
jgi:hypothetical protein